MVSASHEALPTYRLGWQLFAALLSALLLGCSQPLVIEAFGDTPINHPLFSRALALLAAAGIFCLVARQAKRTALLLLPLALCIYNVGLLAFVGYVPLLLVCRGNNPRRCFALGMLAATGQFVLVAYWVVVAMHMIAGIALWLSAALLLLMAAAMALHTATAMAVAAKLQRAFCWPLWLTFAPILCCLDFLRNWFLFDGFPWGSIGYSLASLPLLLQSASLVGVYGLVFYVALVNGCIFSQLTATTFANKKRSMALLLGINAAVVMWGSYRLHSPISQQQTVRVAMLQGNIEQFIKNRSHHHSRDILRTYIALEQQAIKQGAQLIVWPESALPGIYRHDINTFSFLPTINAARIVGVVLRGQDSYYNAAVSINPQGQVVGHSKKAHLVPFGEYVPWPLAGIARKVTPNIGRFDEADQFRPLPLLLPSSTSLLVGTTICFDGVFPEVSRQFVGSGATLLANITNDAWYGISSAPYQHLNMYVMRSVELGRSTIRAANTGISAWIDARGQLHQPTALYQDGVVVADVPLLSERTLYAQWGDILPMLCTLFTLIATILAYVGWGFWRRQHTAAQWLLAITAFVVAAWVIISFYLHWQQLSEGQHTLRLVLALLALFVGCRVMRQ